MIFALLRHRSLAGRLFLSSVILSLFVLVSAGVVLSAINRHNVEMAFDERLKLYLKVLVADIAARDGSELLEIGNLGEPRFQVPLSGWYWQILQFRPFEGDMKEVQVSRSLFSHELPYLGAFQKDKGDFRDDYVIGPGGKKIRLLEQVIMFDEGHRFLIRVSGNSDEIVDRVVKFDMKLVLILGILASAFAISAFLHVRYGLLPLRILSSRLSEVRAGEKDRVEGNFPLELAPLVQELNQMLEAKREIVNRARAQVGNLAHALKTPLSVLLNEADLTPSHFSEKIREQCLIMHDQTQYYLDRARVAASALTLGDVTDVFPVITSFVRIFEKIYRERALNFSCNLTEGTIRFRGEKQDLEEMVGNLIDNAGKWAKTKVEVSVERNNNTELPQFYIIVDDDGLGLSPTLREEVLKRGRRLDETKPGSGLGLSIVLELATLYDGKLSLEDSPLGGVRARLLLPISL